jgi:hypothetical protein
MFASTAESVSEYGSSEAAMANSFQAHSDLANALSRTWVGLEPADAALAKADGALAQPGG